MLNNTGRIGIVFQHWSARVSKHQYRRDWALTVCGNTIFASSKHPVARYGPMTRVARVRRNTRCGVPLHSFGGHRCDRNTNPECFDARKLVAAGCPPKKCCRNTHFLQCVSAELSIVPHPSNQWMAGNKQRCTVSLPYIADFLIVTFYYISQI